MLHIGFYEKPALPSAGTSVQGHSQHKFAIPGRANASLRLPFQGWERFLIAVAWMGVLFAVSALWSYAKQQPPSVAAMAFAAQPLQISQPAEEEWNLITPQDSVSTSKSADLLAASPKWQYAQERLGASVMSYLVSECRKQGVPVALALGVIEAESNFTPDIVSPTNDYGLMQIHAGPNNRYHEHYKELLGVSNFLDPYDNITVGVYLLGENMRVSQKNIQLSLMSYHLGQGEAKQRWAAGVRNTSATRKQLKNYYAYCAEQPSRYAV